MTNPSAPAVFGFVGVFAENPEGIVQGVKRNAIIIAPTVASLRI